MDNTSWKDLFASGSGAEPGGAGGEVLVFKKAGEPLLIVPRGEPGMAAALDLYPAQTIKARLARAYWRQVLRCGLRAGADTDRLALNNRDPFIQFLEQVSRPNAKLPGGKLTPSRLAILAGNPHAPGRRFLVLVFSDAGRPETVVKAGATPKAVELIEKEVTFLTQAPADLIGIPQVRKEFRQGGLRAFALDYVAGSSPAPEQASGVELLMENWLHTGRHVKVKELAAWQRLVGGTGSDALFRRISPTLAEMLVRTAVFHGDLAPWNIKVSDANGAWVALDWERGEVEGPPAWDWFHFVLQPAMLVRRESAGKLARRAEALMESAAFGAYARQAGLAGHERAWLLGYLLYCRDVLRPAEGSPRVEELLKVLGAQWMNE